MTGRGPWWRLCVGLATLWAVSCGPHTLLQDRSQAGPQVTSAAPSASATLPEVAVGAVASPVSVAAGPLFVEGPFAEARAAFGREDWDAAYDGFVGVLESEAAYRLSGVERRGAYFLAGMAAAEARRHPEAMAAFAVATQDAELRPYALVLEAESALRAGRPEAAVALARSVASDALWSMRAQLVVGLAEARLDRNDAAAEHLAVVAEQGTGETQRRARLGLGRVLVERGDETTGVAVLQDLAAEARRTAQGRSAARLLSRLGAPLAAGGDEPAGRRLQRARKLYAAHRSEQAIAAYGRVRAGAHPERNRAEWCEASYYVGKSHTKLRQHAEAATAYDEVVAQCAGTEWEVDALYNAGRSYWNVGQQGLAIERFETLATSFPAQSYADDALLYVARIQAELGASEAASSTLQRQLARYPDSDMAKEAHWLVFREAFVAGRYQEAAAYAAAHRENAGENDLSTRGRLAYFEGRAQELGGDAVGAVETYADVVRGVPLSYYALLSMGRLRALAPERATMLASTLRPATRERAAGRLVVEPAVLANDGAFRRGLLLLRLGLVDLAQAELEAVSVPPSRAMRWTMAELYQTAGAVKAGQRMAARLVDEPGIFGATGSSEWAMAYPRPYLPMVAPAAWSQGLPLELVYAVMREESGFDPDAESWANAIGLMQLMLPTARSEARSAERDAPEGDDLRSPEISIVLGAAHLGRLARRYGRDPMLTIAAYNGGQGNMKRWLEERGTQPLDLWVEDMPYGQTRNYTKRVLTTFGRYAWLYGDGGGIAVDASVPAMVAADLTE